jgi:two-component system CheB/CheR fusion protein
MRDISDRKAVEEALALYEIRYHNLFESAKDGIFFLDQETGIITDINLLLINLLGCSKETCTEKPIWEISFFKNIVNSKAQFITMQQKELVVYKDIQVEIDNGQKLNVEFTLNCYSINGKKIIQCIIR